MWPRREREFLIDIEAQITEIKVLSYTNNKLMIELPLKTSEDDSGTRATGELAPAIILIQNCLISSRQRNSIIAVSRFRYSL